MQEAAYLHGDVGCNAERTKARARAPRWKAARHHVFKEINSKKAQGFSSRNAPYVYKTQPADTHKQKQKELICGIAATE